MLCELAVGLIQWEFPVCEDGGESKVLRSRTIEDRNQFRATPVKAWESTLEAEFLGASVPVSFPTWNVLIFSIAAVIIRTICSVPVG